MSQPLLPDAVTYALVALVGFGVAAFFAWDARHPDPEDEPQRLWGRDYSREHALGGHRSFTEPQCRACREGK